MKIGFSVGGAGYTPGRSGRRRSRSARRLGADSERCRSDSKKNRKELFHLRASHAKGGVREPRQRSLSLKMRPSQPRLIFTRREPPRAGAKLMYRNDRQGTELHARGRPGRRQQIGLVAQLAAQPRVALAPGLEAPGDRVKQPGFERGLFLNRRSREETRAQLGIPADVVPLAHLILEEPDEHQALCASRFHHQAVWLEAPVEHKMVQDRAEIRRSRQLDIGLSGYLGVVRQHAGVVEQLLSIDGGSGYLLQAQDEELQRLPVIGREQ